MARPASLGDEWHHRGSAGAAVTLTNAKRAVYLCVAANTIISAQLGVPSA